MALLLLCVCSPNIPPFLLMVSRLGCDGQEAIRKTSLSATLTATTPDHDVADGVLQLMNKVPWRWHVHHDCGHQDDSKAHKDLNLWAQLNNDCDTEADNFHQIVDSH